MAPRHGGRRVVADIRGARRQPVAPAGRYGGGGTQPDGGVHIRVRRAGVDALRRVGRRAVARRETAQARADAAPGGRVLCRRRAGLRREGDELRPAAGCARRHPRRRLAAAPVDPPAIPAASRHRRRVGPADHRRLVHRGEIVRPHRDGTARRHRLERRHQRARVALLRVAVLSAAHPAPDGLRGQPALHASAV